MNVQYYHKNIDALGDASRSYIEGKLGSVTEIRKIQQARVEVEQLKTGIFHMSVQLNSGREVFFADADADTINGCIDQIEDELKTQVSKHKNRVRDLMKRGARSIKKRLTIDDNARL